MVPYRSRYVTILFNSSFLQFQAQKSALIEAQNKLLLQQFQQQQQQLQQQQQQSRLTTTAPSSSTSTSTPLLAASQLLRVRVFFISLPSSLLRSTYIRCSLLRPLGEHFLKFSLFHKRVIRDSDS